jgi:hypothetical protein
MDGTSTTITDGNTTYTLYGGATRQVHVVRISDPNNSANFIDVEILNKVSVIFPNGDEVLYNVTAKSPLIDDNTKEGGPTLIGNPETATRRSHMKRLADPADNTQFFDVEIIDKLVFTLVNGKEELFNMPNKNISAMVVDNTGNGLGVPFKKGNTTRQDHIVEIDEVQDINATQTPAIRGGVVKPGQQKIVKGNRLLIEQTDKISFKTTNGAEFLLDVSGSLWKVKDVTVYTQDVNGLNIPPPPSKKDKSIYVRWVRTQDGTATGQIVDAKAPKGTGTTGKPWLGPKTPVKQGPMWRIKDVGILHPWYIWIPKQQAMQLSSVGPADFSVYGEGVSALAHFRRLPELGMARYGIHGYNSPYAFHPIPLPLIGWDSLESAITYGSPGMSYNGGCYTASWDYTPILFLQPGPVNTSGWAPAESIGGPNIYQITGMLPYLDNDNNLVQPSPAAAKKIANKMMTDWNTTSDAFNAWAQTIDGWPLNGTAFPVPGNLDPGATEFGPGDWWNFATPFYNPAWQPGGWTPDPTSTPPVPPSPYSYAFCGGINPAWAAAIPAFQPVYATYIAVGQLDPNVWNTDVYPPVKWT